MAYATAVFFAAAGILHISAAADHTDLPTMLTGFIAVGALQATFAGVLLWRRPKPLLLVGALALTVLAVGIWAISRTRGLSFVDGGHTEPIGFKDAVTVLFELATLPGLFLLASRDLSRVHLPSPRLGTSVLAWVGAAAFALFVPALVLGGAHSDEGHGADHSHSGGESEESEGTKELAAAGSGEHEAGHRDEETTSGRGAGRSHRAGGHSGSGEGSGAASGGHLLGMLGGADVGHTGDGGADHGAGGGSDEGTHERNDRREAGGGHGDGKDRGHRGDRRRHGKRGRRKGGQHRRGGHGGRHGDASPGHEGEHGGGPGDTPQGGLLPPGEPLQGICKEADVCLP